MGLAIFMVWSPSRVFATAKLRARDALQNGWSKSKRAPHTMYVCKWPRCNESYIENHSLTNALRSSWNIAYGFFSCGDENLSLLADGGTQAACFVNVIAVNNLTIDDGQMTRGGSRQIAWMCSVPSERKIRLYFQISSGGIAFTDDNQLNMRSK